MIYALRTHHIRNGFIKIGYSGNPSKRVVSVKTACPYVTTLIYLRDGGRKEEATIHNKLIKYRAKGEWFKDCEEVRKCLNYTFLNCHEFGGNRMIFRELNLFFKSHTDCAYDLTTIASIFNYSINALQENYSYHYKICEASYEEANFKTKYFEKPFTGKKLIIRSNYEEMERSERIRKMSLDEVELIDAV